MRQAEAYQAYARQRGEAAVAGASDTLARVILVAAVVLGLVVVLAVLIRLAFRRGILRPLNEAGAHFDRIADGDLTGAIALRGDNEIGVLYSAMRRMQAGLTEAVASVRHGVEEIHTGSGEIAAGGADMSDRTARQAGSLQEAAANMTQLAHTVQLTAGNADQASRQAPERHATGPARRPGGRRSGAEHARHRRQRAAHRRDRGRGRQHRLPDQYPGAERGGRGGAPASRTEASPWWRARCVRWRSAARRRQEIKGLIDDSAARVEAGVRQVGLAGDTMRDMMVSVDRVTQIVAEISSATAEQAAGIASVNLAVADVERSTQENAAMVEQTAAAAAALESQAQALRRAVAVFQIAEGVGERGRPQPPASCARDPPP